MKRENLLSRKNRNVSKRFSGLLTFSLFICLAFILSACQQEVSVGDQTYEAELLYQDGFDKNTGNWVVEQMEGGKTRWMNGKLDINDKSGCTVWFKERLNSPVVIEYHVTMVDSGGPNDRVSDLNCFWMAIDPDHPNDLFAESEERGGRFATYHPLRLYYVGFGANNNTTTRFRRYPGDGTRPMLPGHDLKDEKFMNIPNQERKVQIVANGSTIQYLVDGEMVFDFHDDNPYTSGWFGFRTVKNHMKIDDFKVWRIKE